MSSECLSADNAGYLPEKESKWGLELEFTQITQL